MTASDAVELDDSWTVAPIGELFESWGGLTPAKSNRRYWGPGVPWASSKDVKTERLASTSLTVTKVAVRDTGLKLCPVGSVLVVMRSGVLAHSLPVAVTDIPVLINQDLKAFYSPEALMNEWLAVYLRLSGPSLLASSRRDGTTVQSLQYPLLKEAVIPVPPSGLRKRILARLAEASAVQAEAASHVAAAATRVERFRAVVLAGACAGRLTEDWRASNAGVASVEHELVALIAKKRKRTASEGGAPGIALPELPESYVVAPLGDAAVLLDYGTSQKCTVDARGVPVLRMGNITHGGMLRLDDLKYHPLDAEIRKLMLREGDLLFNRTNSPERVGKAAVFHDERRMSFASYLIRVRFDPNVADPDFVNLWINSAWGRQWARQVKTDGVSQSNINGTKLAALPLPLPPIEEQREIVARATALLGLADELTERIARAGKAVERSAQAVLAKAFRGELVA